VTEEPSRTQQMRAEVGAFMASHGRSLADMYVVVESRAWLRGFLSGVKLAALVVAISYGVWYWWRN